MPLALQARLLRVLDERMVTPLGADESQPVDFQLVSASHCDLRRHGRAGPLPRRPVLPPGRHRAARCRRCASASDRAELIRQVLADEGLPGAVSDARRPGTC